MNKIISSVIWNFKNFVLKIKEVLLYNSNKYRIIGYQISMAKIFSESHNEFYKRTKIMFCHASWH